MRIAACALFLFSFITPGYAQHANHLLIPYRDGELWGYSDTLGNMVIPARYSTARPFSGRLCNGEAIAMADRGTGSVIINQAGKELLSQNGPYRTGQVCMDDGWYFIADTPDYAGSQHKPRYGVYHDNRWTIPPSYDNISSDRNNRFRVKRGEKYGLYKADGGMLAPLQYDEVEWREARPDEKPGHIYWELRNGGKTRQTLPDPIASWKPSDDDGPDVVKELVIVDRSAGANEKYSTSKEREQQIKDGVKQRFGLQKLTRISDSIDLILKNGTLGLLYGRQQLVLFNGAYEYVSGAIRNRREGSNLLLAVKKNGLYGIINEREEWMLPPAYDTVEFDVHYALLRKNRKLGFFVYRTVYPVIEPKYDDLISDDESLPVDGKNWEFLLFFVSRGGQIGWLGENGIEFFRN